MTVVQHKIIHEPDKHIFYIDLDNAEMAYLKYRILDNNQIDFTSTLVPKTHRGQGIAAQLVAEGFAWADQENLTIKASCWYAQKKLMEREEI